MARIKDEMYQRVLIDIMEEMQKDFYDEGWWKNTTIDKEPLILGIWEFKEEALELGFTIGIT
jgi:hypothetical protein|tara:strand:- start:252 stop:437 length:186 start_codon:yes stop_codon:yes gene_type:complete